MNKKNTTSLFNQYSRSSRSLSCKNLLFFKYSNTTKTNYLYFMVGKKYGTAVQRNILKRWIRVLYRDFIKQQGSLGLMVRPLKNKISFSEAQFCFDMLKEQLQDS